MKKILWGLLGAVCCITSVQASTLVCTAVHSTRDDWATGFVADVLVSNTGDAPVSGWKVKWTYSAPVAAAGDPWRAKVKIKGADLTAVDNGENPSIAAGGSVKFGLPLSFQSAKKPKLKKISVNGVGCEVAEKFYADPNSNASLWAKAHPTDGRADDIQAFIADQPAARWFGDWTTDIGGSVASFVGNAAAAKRTPILVAYNIPSRDSCGLLSSGGAPNAEAYRTWISAYANGIADRPAVVVLEPDALPDLNCLTAEKQTERLDLLNYAAQQFKQKAPKAKVYMDIGNPDWLTADVAASRLISAGVANARGFSLNVSNYKTTDANTTYGQTVVGKLAAGGVKGKTFLIDTSRNGNGPLGSQWCDPPGRRIGTTSTEILGGSGAEMTLWVKSPGNTDGCYMDLPAGTFDPELAFKLIYGY